MEQKSNYTTREPRVGSTGLEAGVIIMGLSCVCVVACALVILQIRSVRIQRRRRRRQQEHQSATNNNTTFTRTLSQDPLEASAPPSYDAVMRSPQLYPPSPRSSISSIRRLSTVSGLSQLGSRLSSRVSPETGIEDSVGSNASEASNKEEDDLPPPYPGDISCYSNDGMSPIANIHSVSVSASINPRSPSSSNCSYVNDIELSPLNGSLNDSRNHSASRKGKGKQHTGNYLSRVGAGLRTAQGDHHSRCRGYSLPGNVTVVRPRSRSPSRTRKTSDETPRQHSKSFSGNELTLPGYEGRSSSLFASTSTLLSPHSSWDSGSYPRELTFARTGCSRRDRERRASSADCQCQCHKQT
ncbi:uncharacterized protein LOC116614917 [Nematostella vectensis]|uniref:uncharacterized protein LOC116614917 n=1 Tax=Nematostella vectensis TaxID=45351 RepID=UPI002076E30A|nr:uncharacterized protein LOC116614917 [Nematostella vectensis]